MIYYPYSHAQLEELANKLNQRYDAGRLKKPSRVDVYDIVDLLGARIAFEFLSPTRSFLGATIFNTGPFYVWPEIANRSWTIDMMPKLKLFYGGTIIIDQSLSESSKKRDHFIENFTVMHECFHFAKHKSAFECDGHMSRSFTDYNREQTNKNNALYWLEHQANYAAAAFLMPREAVEYGARNLLYYSGYPIPFEQRMADDIKGLGYLFGVNYSPMLYRLRELNILEKEFDPSK